MKRQNYMRSDVAFRKGLIPGKRCRPGRPSVEELERRLARVVPAAREIFTARGYVATTLNDISIRSGVSLRTLYHHFGDKEAIFRKVIFSPPPPESVLPLICPEDDLAEGLRNLAIYVISTALHFQSISHIRLMIAESSRYPDLMSQVAKEMYANFTQEVAHAFERLSEDGVIPDRDHLRNAKLFVDLMVGCRTIMIYFNWNNVVPSERDIDVKVDMFIKGCFRGI